jgi:hypothetical protein
MKPAAGAPRQPDPLVEEGKPMADWTRPAARAQLPPRPQHFHWRCRQSNSNRHRRPHRGAQRQPLPGRKFSVPMRTWPMARSSLIGSDAKNAASASLRLASITQVSNSTAVRAGRCETARARDHPAGHLDRISHHATADHGRDGSIRAASFPRPSPASRRVRSNRVVCCRYASLPLPRNC